MIDYKKFGIISIRICAISFLISGVLELMMIVLAMLLVSGGKLAPEMLMQEIWFLQALLWFVGGTFLYVRSRSLGAAIVESLFPEEEDLGKAEGK